MDKCDSTGVLNLHKRVPNRICAVPRFEGRRTGPPERAGAELLSNGLAESHLPQTLLLNTLFLLILILIFIDLMNRFQPHMQSLGPLVRVTIYGTALLFDNRGRLW